MSSNIYWTCPTCGAQLPAEKLECPRCAKAKAKAAKAQAKVQAKGQPKQQPAPARPKESSFSQHPELYEWEAKREAEGRDRMRTSAAWALLIGALFAGLVYFLTEQADPQARIIATTGAGALIGFAYYRWSHDSGFQMVVEAQRALVAIETEQNTREIARLLQKPEWEPQSEEDSEATPTEESNPKEQSNSKEQSNPKEPPQPAAG
jgi:hypothetical protein